jgi:hypothetical protein
MTDRQRVYHTTLAALKEALGNAPQGQVVTLAMMIMAIVTGKKAQLSVMSGEVPHDAEETSIERRMRRFVADERVKEGLFFMPFARALLASLGQGRLVLALDGSVVGRGCMVLMVGVVYHQRVLPLTWLVYRGKKGHASAEQHITLLAQLYPLLPPGVEVVLLGDGEYDNTAMFAWIERHTSWYFVVRTGRNLTYRSGTVWYKVGHMALTPGSRVVWQDIAFTDAAYGPLTLLGWWDARYQEPLYLLTNLTDAALACRLYRKRFRLETLFSDVKSRGFHIHKSHLRDPARLSRLLMAVCLAYIWMICLGLFTLLSGQRHKIDRRKRRDKSLFRLGLDWLRRLLRRGDPLWIAFELLAVLRQLTDTQKRPSARLRLHTLAAAA